MASNCGQPCWPPPLLLLLAAVWTCPYSHAFVTGVWTDIENRSSITTGDFLLNATALAHGAGLRMAVDAPPSWALQASAAAPDDPLHEQLMDVVDEVTLMDYWTSCRNGSLSRSPDGLAGLCDPTQVLFLAAPWLSYANFLQRARNRTVRVDIGVAVRGAHDRPGLSPGRIASELQLEIFLRRASKYIGASVPSNKHWANHFRTFGVFDHSKYAALAPCPADNTLCRTDSRVA